MHRVAAIYAGLDFVRKFIIYVFFSGVIIICGVEVFLRYTGLRVLGWTVEVVKYMNVWLIMLGSSLAAKHSLHLTMGVILNLIPGRWRVWADRCIHVAVIGFLLLLCYHSATKTIQNIPQHMMEFPISVSWTYLALPVGFFYMILDYTLILVCGRHPFVQEEQHEAEVS
jgi:TRAP-type C4-dicarboxylate transport system permease small subunit